MALDRETVVRTALRLLDEVGLEKLTLRLIAGELGVKAPALYWHFASKKELLDAMATTVIADAVRTDEVWADRPWSEFLHDYAQGLRSALLRYRDGAKMVPGTYLTDASMFSVMERALGVLTAAGFDAPTAGLALGTVYNYTVGHAIEEQAVRPRPGERDAAYDPEVRRRRLDPATQPTVVALHDMPGAGDPGAEFARGLDLIVAGLRTHLPTS